MGGEGEGGVSSYRGHRSIWNFREEKYVGQHKNCSPFLSEGTGRETDRNLGIEKKF